MPESGSINSPATDILTRLLKYWPHQIINSVLLGERDAKAQLLAGEVESK